MASGGTVIVELSVANLWALSEVMHKTITDNEHPITVRAMTALLEELCEQTEQVKPLKKKP